MIVHIKYHGYRPCGFKQEDFFMFSLFKPIDVKHVTPGTGHF